MQFVFQNKFFKRLVFKFTRGRTSYNFTSENLRKRCKRDVEKCGKKQSLRPYV